MPFGHSFQNQPNFQSITIFMSNNISQTQIGNLQCIVSNIYRKEILNPIIFSFTQRAKNFMKLRTSTKQFNSPLMHPQYDEVESNLVKTFPHECKNKGKNQRHFAIRQWQALHVSRSSLDFCYFQIGRIIFKYMGNSKSLYSKQEFLYYYIEKNDIVSINKLLEEQPAILNDPLTKDTKHNALMRAAFNGNMQLVQLLLSMKAEVNSMTPKGETALTIAVKRNHQKVAEILIDAGANVAHVSKVGLRVIEYAILAGFYELAQLIFRKLPQQEKEGIQDPKTYAELGKKYAYRYVNYDKFLEGLILNRQIDQMPNFLKKQKVKLVDPVVDPRQTWKQWLKRQLEWKDAPLVERHELPENLQPQNRVLGKVHHFTNNLMSTHLSQKTILQPKENRQTISELGELNTKKAVAGGQTEEKMNFEARSEV